MKVYVVATQRYWDGGTEIGYAHVEGAFTTLELAKDYIKETYPEAKYSRVVTVIHEGRPIAAYDCVLSDYVGDLKFIYELELKES